MTQDHRPEQDSEPTETDTLSASPTTDITGEAPEANPSDTAAVQTGLQTQVESGHASTADDEPNKPELSKDTQDDPPSDASGVEGQSEQESSAETSADTPPAFLDEDKQELLPQDFQSLGLPDLLISAVDKLGWQKPSPVQAKSFSPFFSGRDVLVQSHTGSGKTGAFCLPWIAKQCNQEDADDKRGTVRFLAVVPTRELAKQVAKEFGNLADGQTLRIESFYGGTAIVPQLSALEQGVDVVVGTPGRLLDHLRRKSLDLSKLETVVLDECDEMLSMGFLEDIRAILDHCPKDRQTGLFSATLPPDILRITKRYLDDPVHVELSGDQIAAREIDHAYYHVTNSVKTRDLLDVLMVEDPPTGIVFCNTREETRMVSSVLQREGFAAQAISSDLTQSAREAVLADMREHKLRFLVATDVAARGIDISHITHVINYSFPNVAESYVHRTGRTGRAGKSGVAISLISPLEIGDFYLLKKQYADLNITERELPSKQELDDQRRELKIDKISGDLSKPVSPEWVALARDLQKDPRGERVLAYLLYRAHKEGHKARVQARVLSDDEGTQERGEDPRRGRGRSRRDGRDSGEVSGRDRTRRSSRGRRDEARGEFRDRRDRTGEELQAPQDSIQESDSAASSEESSDRSGRTPRRERVARGRRDGSFRSGRGGSRRRRRDSEDRDYSSEYSEQNEELESGDTSEEREGESREARSDDNRRRRRRRRRGPREEGSERDSELKSDDEVSSDDSEGEDSNEEALSGDLDTDTPDQDSDDTEARDPSRRRRKRRRRSKRGGSSDSEDQDATEQEDDASGDLEADSEGSKSRSRRRRRTRGGRRSGGTSERSEAPRVSQDNIILDIDEDELEVVRDEFGEINELDDLTVKGRRRGYLDELESGDDVILEDLSQKDRDSLPAADQDDESSEDDSEDSEQSQDEPTELREDREDSAPQEDSEEQSDESNTLEEGEAPRKKRRRKRRKKRQPPPMPELTAPPHKDFWEVWSDKFSASDFAPLEQEDQEQLQAEAEQKEAARAKRAEERKAAAQARKEQQKARAQARKEQAREREQEESDNGDAAASPRPRVAAASSDESPSGFARISLNIGRGQGCKSATIRKLLEERCGLGRSSVRDLTVRTASTLLQIDETQLEAVQSALNGHTLEDTVLEVSVLDGDSENMSSASPAEAVEAVKADKPEDPPKVEVAADEEPASEEPEAQDSEPDLDTPDTTPDTTNDEEALDAPAAEEEPEPAVAKTRSKKKASKKKRSTKKKASKKKASKKASSKKSAKKKATKKKSTKKKASKKKATKRASKKSAAKS